MRITITPSTSLGPSQCQVVISLVRDYQFSIAGKSGFRDQLFSIHSDIKDPDREVVLRLQAIAHERELDVHVLLTLLEEGVL